MKGAIRNKNEAMVTFEDYRIFVPKNIKSDMVIVKGKVFVNELSIEEQRHFTINV